MGEKHRSWAEALLMLGLCITLVGPGVLIEPDLAVGASTRDLYDHLALLDLWTIHTTDLRFPEGGRLLPPDLSGMVLAAPWMGLGRATAWNISAVLQLWLACLAGAWLGRRLGVSGLVVGVSYGLSPYLAGQLVSGESETLAAWSLPVVAGLCLTPGVRHRVAAGLAAAVGAMCSWYYGAFLVIYVSIRWTLDALRERSLRPFVGLLAMGIGVAPLSLVYAWILKQPDQLFRGPSMSDYLTEHPRALAGMSADPMAWLGVSSQGASTHVDALGWVSIVFAVVGALAWPHRRWWLGVLLGGLLMSVGPVLHLGGTAVWSWMPYRLLAEFPLFGLMRLPHRWMLFATLGLAVLAGRGARRLPWLGAFLIVMEVLWFVVPVRPAQPIAAPQVTTHITGPVLELPARMLGGDARGHYLVWQRTHEQPIPYSLLMTGWSEVIAKEPLFIAVAAADGKDRIADQSIEARQFRQEAFAVSVSAWRADPQPTELVGAAERLRALGLEQVVLHPSFLRGDDANEIQQLLEAELGEPNDIEGALLWNL